MSAATYNQIGRWRTYSLQNVPVTATAIFTASKVLGETVREILVSNKDSSARTVTIQLYRAANTTSYSIVTGYSIATGAQFRCDFPIQMLDGDQIRCTAGTFSTLDAFVTVSESIGRGG